MNPASSVIKPKPPGLDLKPGKASVAGLAKLKKSTI